MQRKMCVETSIQSGHSESPRQVKGDCPGGRLAVKAGGTTNTPRPAGEGMF